jgi:HEAT repeat protein
MPLFAGRQPSCPALGLILIWVLGADGSARAAQLSSAGDGSLQLQAGTAVVARINLATPPLRRGTPALREVTVEGHHVAEIRVPVRGTASQEVWVGDLAAKPARVIWSGVAGARELDGEVAVEVEVSTDRIVEYQTAAHVTRCDGEAVRLFPRAWDFGSRRFRPIVSSVPEVGAQKLIARRGATDMPAGRPISGFRWTAASTTTDAGSDARWLAAPLALDDGNPATAWAEGLGGDGVGEFLTARSSAGGYPVRGLRILPGDASSRASFRGKNRVKRFLLALGPKPEQQFDVEIPDDPAADATRWREPYWVALPRPVPSSCVTMVLTEVIRGGEASPPKNFGTTAISDIDVFTELDGPAGADRLVADIAAGTDCEARIPLLVTLGTPAVAATAKALPAARGGGRECLLEALVQLVPAPNDAAVVAALIATLSGSSVREERLVATALLRAGALPVAGLAALLADSKADIEDRQRAARLLGTLEDPAAAAALLAAAGRGPGALREEVIVALGHSAALSVNGLLEAVARDRKDGPATDRYIDLLRALPAAGKRTPDKRAQILAALREALAPANAFSIRARAVMALGDLGSVDGVPDLAHLRSGSDDPVLRYLAVRELGDIGGGDAVVALRAALGDQDPRVRETAAVGLGQHQDQNAGAALIAGAKQEPWPFVRRAELDALGHLCVPGGGDLMIRAVERDVDEVRRAALVSLMRCRDPRSKTVLLQTLGRRNEAATLRELAAALLGELGDKSAAPQVAAALKRLVVESEADLALEGVAASTLRGLARLGGREAVAMAVTLADDTRHPLRQIAIEALGTLCDPGAGAATLRRLASGADPSLAAAAQGAERRCAASVAR